MSQLTYLGKDGKTFGPFPNEEIEALKISGKFYDYEYFWDGSTPEWQRVPQPSAPPPPLPSIETSRPVVAETEPVVSRTTTRPALAGHREFQAICHDFHRMMSGRVLEPSSAGARLVYSDTQKAPPFKAGVQVWMDLLDETTDRSVTIKARLNSLSREGVEWVYAVSWDHCPLL